MRRAVQLTVQAIVPGMIRAANARLEYAVLLVGRGGRHEFGAAMPAHVVERVQFAALVTHEQDALPGDVDETIVSPGLKPFAAPGAKPLGVKDCITLAREMLHVEIMLARQRRFELLDIVPVHVLHTLACTTT